MRTTVVTLALAGLAGSAAAQTTIDFNALAIDAAQPITFTVLQTDPGPLLGFSWDLMYDAGNGGSNASWGAELNIVLTHVPSGFSIMFDGGEPNLGDTIPSDVLFGWGESSGIFTSTDSIAWDGPSDTLGVWEVFIFEDFDDFGVDGILDGYITINKVPAPGGLAVLGLGGAVCLRRRRA